MAVETQSSQRIQLLARPKPTPDGFFEDRRSVYWIDRYPHKANASGTTDFAVTARLNALAQPKRVHALYKGDRPTPMWPVSEGAQKATTSERLQSLAREKTVVPAYRYHRPVYTEVGPGALQGSASARVETLSQPKPHKVWLTSQDTLSEGEFHLPITAVPPSARRGVCTPRVDALSEHKNPHAYYRPERTIMWPVSDNAMNATATQRVQQLARPKSGRMRKDDYDPYKVSIGARLARATPRVQELCAPIPRKVRQKIAV